MSAHWRGFAFGVLAAILWSLIFIFARRAHLEGLAPQDVVLLRFGIAGVILIPIVLRSSVRSLAGVGWGKGAVLALGAGPVFTYLAAAGVQFAPMSHGAVLQPSTAFLASAIVAILMLGERLTRLRVIGSSLVFLGLICVSGAGVFLGEPGAWRGDLMFVSAGLLWALYTIMLRVWGFDGLTSAAAINVIGLLVTVPLFVLWDSFDRLLALPLSELLLQAIVHGVLVAVVALIAFGQAVRALGVTRSALFPAMVPAFSLILGIPILGEIPTAFETFGAVLATLGLVIALRGQNAQQA